MHALVRQSLQLPAINEGLEDILLDIEVVVVDGRERCPQRRSRMKWSRAYCLKKPLRYWPRITGVGQVHVLDLGL
jgi:hypothetical protein